MVGSGSRRVGSASGYPGVRTGIVSSSRVDAATPHDHFTPCPDRRVIVSERGRVGGAGGCPTIHAGIVSGAGGQEV